MAPGDLYVLAIVVTALFVAPFNAMARVIVLAWIVGHVCFTVGVPEVWANIGGQTCVLVIGARHLRCAPALMAWSLSIPLILVNLLWFVGIVRPDIAWWAILYSALAQLLILPFTITAETREAISRAWYTTSGRGFFRKGATE